MTRFTTDAGDGSVISDTVTAGTITATTGFVGNLTGNVTGSISGGSTTSLVPQLITAAGASQGAATALTGSPTTITGCTPSPKPAKLPSPATGKMVYVMSLATQGCKIYPLAGPTDKTSPTNTDDGQVG